jgi:S1-C subfamily serine protease
VIDLLVIVLVIGAGALGFQRGFVVSCIAAGAFLIVGLPVAAIASAAGTPPPALAFILGGMIGAIPVAIKVEALGERVHEHVSERGVLTDRIAGMCLNSIVAISIAWFIGSVAYVVPADTPAISAIRASSVVGRLTDAVPPDGTLGAIALRSGVIPGLNGPIVIAARPDPASARTIAVTRATASVLQVRGTACGKISTGTAWVAGKGLLLTNAHVVAGHRTTFLAGGPQYEGVAATVTYFDPVNDVAVLALDDNVLPAVLPISLTVQHGEPAATIGFPNGGEQWVEPARIDRIATYEVEVLGQEPRTAAVKVLTFRGELQPGNSGGPIMSEQGVVLGMVSAKAIGQRVAAGYAIPGSVLGAALASGSRRQPVDTNDCLDSRERAGSNIT